jgi:hypothetical protein
MYGEVSFPARDELAYFMGRREDGQNVSVRTVTRTIAGLERKGWLVVSHRRDAETGQQETSRYQLRVPDQVAPSRRGSGGQNVTRPGGQNVPLLNNSSSLSFPIPSSSEKKTADRSRGRAGKEPSCRTCREMYTYATPDPKGPAVRRCGCTRAARKGASGGS